MTVIRLIVVAVVAVDVTVEVVGVAVMTEHSPPNGSLSLGRLIAIQLD